MIFEITIPEKVSMNAIYSGMPWRKRVELADLYHNEFLDVKKVKVTQYPVAIHYDWHFVNKPLDTLNCAFMSKMLEDGMVHAKILDDDSTAFVRRSIVDSQKSTKYKHDTVVVTITPFTL